MKQKTINYQKSVDSISRYLQLSKELEARLVEIVDKKSIKICVKNERSEQERDLHRPVKYLFCYDILGVVLFEHNYQQMEINRGFGDFDLKVIPSSRGQKLIKSLEKLAIEYGFEKIL